MRTPVLGLPSTLLFGMGLCIQGLLDKGGLVKWPCLEEVDRHKKKKVEFMCDQIRDWGLNPVNNLTPKNQLVSWPDDKE